MVPNGWDVIKLRDVGKCLTGLTYSPKNVVDNGLLVLRSSNVQDSKLAFEDNVYVDLDVPKEGRTKYGDILLCVRNGSRRLIGKSAFITQEAEGYAHGAFMGLFRPIDTPDYTFQLFQSESFFKQVNQNLGATINSINSGNLYDFKFPYPPIQEREKIAKILSTWDEAISTTEHLIDNSTQQKKALMQQLLTGKKRLLDDEGKRFEGKWEEVKLSKWLIEYKEKSTTQDQYDVYTSSRNGLVLQSDYFANSRIAGRDNIGFHVIPPNHITYRSRSDDGFFTFNLFSSDKNGLISNYYPVFSTKGINEFFIALFEQYRAVFGRYSVGTSQKVLSLNALKDISFKIPNLPEQQKIATLLTNADKEIELLEQQLADLQQEKKALMQVLLTGKKRVVVDG